LFQSPLATPADRTLARLSFGGVVCGVELLVRLWKGNQQTLELRERQARESQKLSAVGLECFVCDHAFILFLIPDKVYYTVTAADSVNDQLARIWLQAFDPNAVSQASNTIDHLLKFSPLSCGTDQGNYRTLTVEPLTVVYTVSPADCQVEIPQYICQE